MRAKPQAALSRRAWSLKRSLRTGATISGKPTAGGWPCASGASVLRAAEVELSLMAATWCASGDLNQHAHTGHTVDERPSVDLSQFVARTEVTPAVHCEEPAPLHTSWLLTSLRQQQHLSDRFRNSKIREELNRRRTASRTRVRYICRRPHHVPHASNKECNCRCCHPSAQGLHSTPRHKIIPTALYYAVHASFHGRRATATWNWKRVVVRQTGLTRQKGGEPLHVILSGRLVILPDSPFT